jgi:hypothetical protein
MEDVATTLTDSVDTVKLVAAGAITAVSNKLSWVKSLSRKQRILLGAAVFFGVIIVLTLVQAIF